MNEKITTLSRYFNAGSHDSVLDAAGQFIDSHGPEEFYRMNPALLAQSWGLDRQLVLDVFLAGTLEGLFELRWDYHCPHCNGIAGFSSHLRTASSENYCALCQVKNRNMLDKNVEVTFSTSPGFMEIPAAFVEQKMQEMMAAIQAKSLRMPDVFLSGLDCVHNVFFHEHFAADVLSVEETLEVKSLTLLFTDIKGSTRLYETLGDVRAYNLVREHFKALFASVEANGGVVVKTIGDAVMASFIHPSQALAAALEMRRSMSTLAIPETEQYVEIRIGMHTGTAIAVNLNDRMDYFGHTVNMAARVQGIARPGSVFLSEATLGGKGVKDILAAHKVMRYMVQLKGIEGEQTVYGVGE